MPYVNSWDEKFRKSMHRACENAIENSPETTELVKKLAGDVIEATADRVRDYIENELWTNLEDMLCARAARVAESMLNNALAGDSAELRNLFGFNEWYMKHPYHYADRKPTQWALIDALAARHKDLIVDERVKQREAEIAELMRQIGNLKKLVEHLENPYAEEQKP